MNIGPLILEDFTVLAPLAGVTNLPFRLMVKQIGCGLVCSEMVSANGLVRHSAKTHRMLASIPAEKPLSAQIFGSDPDIMAEAAAMVEASGADVLDINFGCSVRKIVKTGAGVALMRDPARAKKLLIAVRNAVKIPLTIKIRSGWVPSGEQAFELADIAQDHGVDALAFHPRTANQGFSGKANWPLIAALKKRMSIPLIGNGDIFSAADALRMRTETGCDFVMIGRSAISNPWIFIQTRALDKGNSVKSVKIDERFVAMREYLAATVAHFDEKTACYMMRSRLGWLAKGLPLSSKFRDSIKTIASQEEALERIEAYQLAIKHFRLQGPLNQEGHR